MATKKEHGTSSVSHVFWRESRAAGGQPGARAAERVESPAKARCSVLAVDDEENFLTLLHWFLSDRGYKVRTASSVEGALSLAQEQSFQVALLDIKIGSANGGLVLLDQLLQRRPEIKIIMMTAFPNAGTVQQAFDRGAVRLFAKPLDLQELSETIDGLL